MPWAPKKHSRPWRLVDQRRESKQQRGYGGRWEDASKAYRRKHPLCVLCLIRGRTRGSACVDHIVPIACVEALQWEETNWAALCLPCHAWKTRIEPRRSWTPDPRRIVACGVRGAGKREYARSQGCPVFDAAHFDGGPVATAIAARRRWMAKHDGAAIVVVESTALAALAAAEMGGVARHFT